MSLRAAIGLTAIVALALGAWEYRARSIREGLRLIRQHRGMYHYDFEYGDLGFLPKPQSWAPRWLRNLVGVETLHEITYVAIYDPKFGDDDLIRLTRYFPGIKTLGIDRTAVTDRSLAALRGNGHLLLISVRNEGITDAGIDRLDPASLPRLETIDIRNTQVTNSKADEVEAFLKAREAAKRRENPGKWVEAHMVLKGPFIEYPYEAEGAREAYEKKLEDEAESPR